MPIITTARRAACTLLFALATALPAAARSNRSPEIVSQPERLATLAHGYHYAARAQDADGDTLRYSLPTAPAGATIDAATGLIAWRPVASHTGEHPFVLVAEDGKGGRAEQRFQVKVVEDFCPIYPIALPRTRVDGLAPGARLDAIERGTGPGNFSWLTWTGAVDAPTMARSLAPPGDSHNYVDPDDATDRLLNIGDWAQGSTGSMNSNAVRDAMDVLKTIDIVLPVFDDVRGQGSRFDYHVQRFVVVRLLDYRLTGQGFLSFELKGDAHCYNRAPTALPQSLATDEDTALPLTLTGTDPEADPLRFTVLDTPAHGTLSGTPPALVYTPRADYHGPDSFHFRVDDGSLQSAPATIDIQVRPLNDPPRAAPQRLSTPEDTSLPLTLAGSDPETDPLTFAVLDQPAHGSLSGVAPNLVYTPAPGYHGPDAFTFRVRDGALDSPSATVDIVVTPVNDPPQADDQQRETPEDTPLAIVLTGSDPESDPLTFELLDAPAHGRLSGTPPAVVYTPTTGYAGSDRFTFRADDGELDSAPATVSIQVIGRNEPPEIISTPPPRVDEGAIYDYDVDAVDPDVDVLRYSSDRAPSRSAIDAATGRLRWSESDARLVSGIRAPNLACRTASSTLPFEMEVKWAWTGSPQESSYDQVLSTALVAPLFDHNGDGRVARDDAPSVIFLAFLNDKSAAGSGINSARLRVIDGRTGQDQWVSNGSIDLDGHGTPAIGDIDGDGIPEIVTQTAEGGAAAFNRDGTLKWRVGPIAGATRWRVAHLTDLTGDGSVEIVLGDAVLDARGQLLWRLSGFRGGVIARTLVPGLVSIADLDGDGRQEIVAGASAYSAEGTVLWQNATVGDGSTAIADFDRNGQPEIVVVAAGYVSLVRGTDGSRIWGPVAVPGGGHVGPPTIGDMNGDGTPEIGVAGARAYAAISVQGQILWSAATQDASSNVTGSTIADLDGDGRAEVLYRDELFFRIYDGGTGAVLEQVPMSSVTAVEYPVVADIDLDGEAEILVTADDLLQRLGRAGGPRVVGVRAFASASGAWTPTRSIWNQHAYHIDNIEDDGGVPRQPPRSWLTHNTYRLNTFADRHPLGLADLALFDLSLDGVSGEVSVRVTNRGLAPTGAATSIRIYNGDPEQGGTLLGTLPVPVLAAAEARTLTLRDLPADAVDTDLFARVDEAGAVDECLDDNNHTAAAYFVVRATDPEALFDTQRFTATVENVNAAPSLLTEALPAARINQAYRAILEAADPDLGDGLRFERVAGPAGLVIDPISGELRWTPGPTQGGTHTVTVRVVDLGGLSAQRNYTLTVPVNQPPVITSTAILTGQIGVVYRYDVEATDPDGDTLNYTLTNAPVSMQIDAATGVITYTPTAAGSFPVLVEVLDGRGGKGTQAYTLVVTAPVNRAPTITTTPAAQVDEGAVYGYDIDATDPEGDALAYRFDTAPAGTQVAAASGLLSWTADPALVAGLRSPNLMCREAADAVAFDPVVRWHWSGSSTLPSYDQVMSAPVVVPLRDTDGDGRVDRSDTPYVAFVSYGGGGADWGNGVVRVVRGSDGQEAFTVSDSSAYVPSYANLAAGDLDGDGVVEIVAPLQAGGVMAIGASGQVLWKNTSGAQSWNVGGAAIADLEGDGSPEILLGRTVYTATGQIKWQGSANYQGNSHVSAIGTISVAADLRAEPGLEVVSGPSMYSANGTLLWRYDALGDGAIAIGDLDRDARGEIVLVAAGQVVALDVNGAVKWGPVAMGDGGRGGPPTIADFDSDGRPEIGVASRSFYFVFEHDGQLKWKQPIVDYSSNITGSTLFDFDGDGAVEVLQADERKFRVFDGATGQVRLEMDNSNGTAYEFPIVADADRDGSADILLPSNLYYGTPGQKGLRMISSASRNWMPTRSIWNQHAYHVDNIDDDGRVPRQPAKNWLGHNSFRLNTFPDRHPLGLADLALFDLRLDESAGTAVRVLVLNRGLAPAGATTVRFYNGVPGAGGAVLGSLAVPALGPGEAHALLLDDLDAAAVSTNLFARVDEGGAVRECVEANNQAAAAYFAVRATDPPGLFDSQRFTVSVENVNEAPSIETAALPPARPGEAYRFVIEASDPDLGDGLRFELVAGPAGMAIDAALGELRWTPGSAAGATHSVTVRVIDLAGLTAQRSYSLSLSAAVNRAPEITTTPPPRVDEGATYRYDIDATDPDGDTLAYGHTTAPTGTTVAGTSGALAWLAPAALADGVRTPNMMCREPAVAHDTLPFEPVRKWSWGRRSALSMPLVGPLRDTNADGRYDANDVPTVLINTDLGGIDSAAGTLVALDGVTGQELWENATAGTRASATPAIGDIDGDGKPEIVSFVHNGGVAAFDNAGRELWRTPTTTVTDNGYNYGSISLYDLDADGRSEILHHGGVINHDGAVRWRIQPQAFHRAPVYAIDLDGDGKQEVVAGAHFYSSTGTLLRTIAGGNGGWVMTSPGNFDADPQPEFAVMLGDYYSQASEIRVLDTDGSQIWSRIDPNVSRGGPPVVSDLDGDGVPDISFIGMRRHIAYSGDGRLLWSNPIADNSTGTNGSTSFDFDGDGTHEVVSQDEARLRVFDGRTGRTLFEVPHSSPTAAESPIVADVDGNGHADIVVEGYAANGGSVAVYSDVAERWVSTRRIWNQYSYHIDNVEDDGGIPARPASGWLTHNTYRLNSFPDRHALGRVDLALFELELALVADGVSVGVDVVNRGLAPAAATQVRIYNGRPEAGGTLLGTLPVEALAAGAERRVTLGGLAVGAVTEHLYARVDEEGAIAECLEDNNEAAAAYFEVRATDPPGLFDSQRFSVSIANVNEAPRLLTGSVPPAAVNQAYRYTLQASDADRGDALRYTLTAAPAGVTLDALSGELRWTPSATQAGSHTIGLRVTDLGGLTAEATATIVVSDNRPPQFTSTPATSIGAGAEYRYDADATDADGDSVAYALMSAPSGMQIDSASGLVLWAAAVAGSHEIEIRALDGRGSYALQRYTLQVVAAPNRAPQITSTPGTSASSGAAYTYVVDATDPDGDVLSVQLPVKPAGMVIDEVEGELSWTPTASQVGTHAVQVQVIDGRGGSATQDFQIVVTAGTTNSPPQITSTAILAAHPAVEYRYNVDATDPDGDTLAYALAQAPTGMLIDAAGGLIRWTPASDQLGAHAVLVEVSDGRSGTATQQFTVAVSQVSGNLPPTITSAPVFTAKAGREYRYPVIAQDPNGDTLTYSLVTSPAGMTIGTDGRIAWTPAAPGVVPVRVRVADAQAYVEQNWDLDVLAADVALDAVVTVSPTPVQPGGSVTITIVIEGAAAQPTVTATLDGQPLPLDPDGSTTITAPTTPGEHPLIVTVTDGFDTDTTPTVVRVADPADTTAPGVTLLLPAEHADWDAIEISAPTAVTGRVTGSDVARWRLVVQERGGSGVQVLAEGNAALDGAITTFDPTRLLNGQYVLSLQAWDHNGNTDSDTRILRITGDMKLGHFSITFDEVTIPVAGIPVTVSRTYDTRRAAQSLDFGYGWTVDANNVRLHESRRIGFAWDVFTTGGVFGQRCIRPLGDPIVTVTLPDGEVASFKARAEPECRTVFDGDSHVKVVFDPIDGTDHKLEQTNYGTVRWGNIAGNEVGILFDEAAGDTTPIDPRSYRLTTDAGLVYDIDQFEGVSRIFDQGTETHLTYSRDGVRHSSGLGIDFVRDPQGRITQLRLPDQTTVDYGYTPAGDLESVTNQVEATTTFGYEPNPRYPHYLRDIVDPRGVRVSRNEYDETGRLVATIDADGRRVEISSNLAARTQTIKDRRGNSTTYVFDDSGRVLSETNALGETITRSYDAEGNVLTEKDPLQHLTTRTYDARGNLETETNPLLQKLTQTYNAKNQLLTQLDAANRPVLINRYDVRSGQLLTSSEDALGKTTTFGYLGGTGIFGTGQLEAITDPTGATTSFGYNFDGYKNRETDALAHSVTFVLDKLGRTKEQSTTRTVTAADGSTRVETLRTVYTLDDRGRVVATLHPDGSTTTTRYNGNDQPELECDGLQRCTETHYNDRGLVERIDYPDGTFEAKTYDPNGNLDSATDRAGRTTKFVYDAANRLTVTIHPDPAADDGDDSNNPRSVNRYDAAGRIEESVDENRQVTRYRYDDANRRTHVIRTATTTAGEATTVDEYDIHGRRHASTDAEGHRTEYRYDAAGRLTETIHPDPTVDDGNLENNPRTRLEYDAVGRKIAETDEQQRTTRYAYDKVGRLVAVVLSNPVTGANPPLVDGVSPDPGALTTRYRYDEVGNKVEQIDAEGRRTRFEYDAMGRETARVLPGGQRETKEYNDAGELTAHTDFNRKTTRYRYDAGGRLERIDYPSDADVAMQSNGVGERTSVTDGRGVSGMDYDRRGRVLKSTDADGGIIEYQYDDAGNLLARISPSQSLVYTYDARHRLETVTRTVDGEAPSVTRYEYDQDGNRHAMVGGDGTRTEYGYDRRHRLTSLVKKTAAGALMLSMAYTVDGSGMRTAVAEADATGPVRTVAYTYDGVRRLTQESIDHRDAAKDRVTTWTYDDVGNRLTQTLTAAGTTESTVYTYDENDRLLTEASGASTTTYSYDDQGNTLGKSGPAGATTYRYDDANRLIEARTAAATSSYVYNADGLRVRQTVTPSGGPAVTTWYVQDSAYPYAQVIEQYTSSGTGAKRLAATFTFADDLVSQTRYDGAGIPTTRYIQADGFGSTRWLTDGAGAITDSIEYDAFGNEVSRVGVTALEHLYRAESFDSSVGYYYLRARWLDPKAGRFTQSDTWRGDVADPASLHKYTYTHNNPVAFSDPSGHMILVGLDLGGMFSNLGRSIAANSARITANRASGKALEAFVEAQLQRFVAQYGGQVLRQVYFRGPGGVRFADAVVKLGNRFVAIEVKTKMPLGGQALVRLANQIRTFAMGSAPNAALPGTAAEVIVITEESAAALEASFLLVESQVATGTLSGVMQGTHGLMTVLRGVLLGL